MTEYEYDEADFFSVMMDDGLPNANDNRMSTGIFTHDGHALATNPNDANGKTFVGEEEDSTISSIKVTEKGRTKVARKRGPKRKRKQLKGKAPRRSMSAYNFFFQEERQNIIANQLQDQSTKEDKKKVNYRDVVRIVGERWRMTSKVDRKPFEEKAKLDLIRYRKEMETHRHGLLAKIQEEEDTHRAHMKASTLLEAEDTTLNSYPVGPMDSAHIDPAQHFSGHKNSDGPLLAFYDSREDMMCGVPPMMPISSAITSTSTSTDDPCSPPRKLSPEVVSSWVEKARGSYPLVGSLVSWMDQSGKQQQRVIVGYSGYGMKRKSVSSFIESFCQGKLPGIAPLDQVLCPPKFSLQRHQLATGMTAVPPSNQCEYHFDRDKE